MQSKRKERGKTIGLGKEEWREGERLYLARLCIIQRVKRLQKKSSIHVDVVAMASTITSEILPAISKQQHLNLRAHLHENLQYYIPIPCSKRPTHPFNHLLNFQQPTITYLKLMIKHFLNRVVWKINK